MLILFLVRGLMVRHAPLAFTIGTLDDTTTLEIPVAPVVLGDVVANRLMKAVLERFDLEPNIWI